MSLRQVNYRNRTLLRDPVLDDTGGQRLHLNFNQADDLNEIISKSPSHMSQHLDQTSKRHVVVEADQEFRKVRLAFAAERRGRLS